MTTSTRSIETEVLAPACYIYCCKPESDCEHKHAQVESVSGSPCDRYSCTHRRKTCMRLCQSWSTLVATNTWPASLSNFIVNQSWKLVTEALRANLFCPHRGPTTKVYGTTPISKVVRYKTVVGTITAIRRSARVEEPSSK